MWRWKSEGPENDELPLWLHTCPGRWFCTEYLECRSKAGLCECPEKNRLKPQFKKKPWGVSEEMLCERVDSHRTEGQGQRLQDVQHGLQDTAAPQQVRKTESREDDRSQTSHHEKRWTKQEQKLLWPHVSARPDKYLSATLRILLWMWLKLTSRNWAWRSSSSSWDLVFAWKYIFKCVK